MYYAQRIGSRTMLIDIQFVSRENKIRPPRLGDSCELMPSRDNRSENKRSQGLMLVQYIYIYVTDIFLDKTTGYRAFTCRQNNKRELTFDRQGLILKFRTRHSDTRAKKKTEGKKRRKREITRES